MITFLETEECDAQALKEIQTRSFSVDVDLCGDGPPGYDSIDWQLQIIKSHIYYKVIKDEIIIGGFYRDII